MTIQEAIKSGRPFKRIDGEMWNFISPDGFILEEFLNGVDLEPTIRDVCLTVEDILSSRWEIQPHKRWETFK